jgi:predicted transcriptional regulator
MDHALISIHPEHVSGILNGEKTVEIRTRRARLDSGTTLWIYATLPLGEIRASAQVKNVSYLSPTRAWLHFEHSLGLTRSLFRTYVNGSSVVSVIELTSVIQLQDPVPLKRIRRIAPQFQPPQFFMRLHADDPVYELLSRIYPKLFR